MNIQITLTGQELVELVNYNILTIEEARGFLGLNNSTEHSHDNHVHD